MPENIPQISLITMPLLVKPLKQISSEILKVTEVQPSVGNQTRENREKLGTLAVSRLSAVCRKIFIKRVNLSMLMTQETMGKNPGGEGEQGTRAS